MVNEAVVQLIYENQIVTYVRVLRLWYGNHLKLKDLEVEGLYELEDKH